MTKASRQKIILDIEAIRGSRVISYFNADRQGYPQGVVPNLATSIAGDLFRPLYDHLKSIGHQEKIDLFLYSRGGDTNVPYRLVTLIREFCSEFSVLVPFRAHSAATMICLGADKLYMGELGSISPVDPTTANMFNPIDPLNPSGRWPISVEDVTSYFNLAKDIGKLNTEESIQGVFKALTDKVNPIALGNVQRVYNLIRMLVPKLLSLHMDISNVETGKKVKKITQTLSETLYTHSYPICREEAKEILGDSMFEPSPPNLESKMWELFLEYETDLKLLIPFNPSQLIQAATTFSEETGYIESTSLTHGFIQEGEFIPQPTLQRLQQVVQIIPQQIIAQIAPQLIIQIANQLAQNPPSVKFTSQLWEVIP